ncbi:hypothetical protein [Aquimarina rhabdastrellae]
MTKKIRTTGQSTSKIFSKRPKIQALLSSEWNSIVLLIIALSNSFLKLTAQAPLNQKGFGLLILENVKASFDTGLANLKATMHSDILRFKELHHRIFKHQNELNDLLRLVRHSELTKADELYSKERARVSFIEDAISTSQLHDGISISAYGSWKEKSSFKDIEYYQRLNRDLDKEALFQSASVREKLKHSSLLKLPKVKIPPLDSPKAYNLLYWTSKAELKMAKMCAWVAKFAEGVVWYNAARFVMNLSKLESFLIALAVLAFVTLLCKKAMKVLLRYLRSTAKISKRLKSLIILIYLIVMVFGVLTAYTNLEHRDLIRMEQLLEEKNILQQQLFFEPDNVELQQQQIKLDNAIEAFDQSIPLYVKVLYQIVFLFLGICFLSTSALLSAYVILGKKVIQLQNAIENDTAELNALITGFELHKEHYLKAYPLRHQLEYLIAKKHIVESLLNTNPKDMDYRL